MKLTKLIEQEEPNATVIMAPESTTGVHNGVFLAGSIDMGKAVDWQTQITNKCKDDSIVFFNPRRDDWDSTWEQKITNKKFREQVEWELDSMEKAEKIVYYFDPKGTAPITLLELGIHSQSKKICVCCPTGYFRKGNVDIVCNKYDIPMVDDIDGLIKFIRE